jgi:hypothetical protein
LEGSFIVVKAFSDLPAFYLKQMPLIGIKEYLSKYHKGLQQQKVINNKFDINDDYIKMIFSL